MIVANEDVWNDMKVKKKHILLDVVVNKNAWPTKNTLLNYYCTYNRLLDVDILNEGVQYKFDLIKLDKKFYLDVGPYTELVDYPSIYSSHLLKLKNLKALLSFVDYIVGRNHVQILFCDNLLAMSDKDMKTKGFVAHIYYAEGVINVIRNPTTTSSKYTESIIGTYINMLSQFGLPNNANFNIFIFTPGTSFKDIFELESIKSHYNSICTLQKHTLFDLPILHISPCKRDKF